MEDKAGHRGHARLLAAGRWPRRHVAFTLLVAALITGVVNAVITAPFSAGAWLLQGIAAAVATTVTLPYGALVGVLLNPTFAPARNASTSTPSRQTCQATAA